MPGRVTHGFYFSVSPGCEDAQERGDIALHPPSLQLPSLLTPSLEGSGVESSASPLEGRRWFFSLSSSSRLPIQFIRRCSPALLFPTAITPPTAATTATSPHLSQHLWGKHE